MKKGINQKQIQKFKRYLQDQEKSTATIEKYVRDIRKFSDFLSGSRFGRREILGYKSFLTGHYKAASVNSMLAALNCFLSWQGLQEWKVKPLKIQRRVFRPAEEELTKKEYSRLLYSARKMNDQRLSLIMQTLCATGIRISELAFITAESIKEGSITVNCKNKTRYIWMPKPLQVQLRKYIAVNGITKGTVFVTSSGKAVGRSSIWRQMKQTAKAAGINERKVYPHNLRHLFARTFYEMNKDIVKLSDILGHSSVETTRIYTMTTGREHAEYLEKMGLVYRNT